MKAKLIQETQYIRLYELSEPITKGKSDMIGDLDLIDLAKYDIESITKSKSEKLMKFLDELKKPVKYVLISDATTHVERLVFSAYKVEGKIYRVSQDILGYHTFMIDGGDPDKIYPDEVYLRKLCMLNGLKYEGVVSKF